MGGGPPAASDWKILFHFIRCFSARRKFLSNYQVFFRQKGAAASDGLDPLPSGFSLFNHPEIRSTTGVEYGCLRRALGGRRQKGPTATGIGSRGSPPPAINTNPPLWRYTPPSPVPILCQVCTPCKSRDGPSSAGFQQLKSSVC